MMTDKEREVSKCDCPYCGMSISYFLNENDFLFKICPRCDKYFWIRPHNSDVKDKAGKKPNTVHLIMKEELDYLIDAGLIIRDWEMVKYYSKLRESMEGDYVIYSVASDSQETLEDYLHWLTGKDNEEEKGGETLNT